MIRPAPTISPQLYQVEPTIFQPRVGVNNLNITESTLKDVDLGKIMTGLPEFSPIGEDRIPLVSSDNLMVLPKFEGVRGSTGIPKGEGADSIGTTSPFDKIEFLKIHNRVKQIPDTNLRKEIATVQTEY
jgi:hypothetical protein